MKCSNENNDPKILVGNTHLEYTVADRARQMQFCIERLSGSSQSPASTPALSVLCGDTNVESYAEIADNFLANGFVDALVAANSPPLREPIPELESVPVNAIANETGVGASANSNSNAPGIDLFLYMPTFGQAGIKFTGRPSKERVGRLDYVLCRAEHGTLSLSSNPASSANDSSLPAYSAQTDIGDAGDNPNADAVGSATDDPTSGHTTIADAALPVQGKMAKVISAHMLGVEMIPREIVKKVSVDDPTMSVFPSDHLGVIATVHV